MEVIRHECIRMDGHGVPGRLALQQPEKELEVRRTAEHRAAAIATLHDVLGQSRKADARAARHVAQRRKSRSQHLDCDLPSLCATRGLPG